MTEDFAVLDFALVGAAPLAVARALATAEAQGRPEEGPAPGLLSRLLGRGRKPTATAQPPLLAQPPGTLTGGVLAREMLDDMGFGGTDHEARLSAPLGDDGLTLIEFRERTDGAPSPRLTALSQALPGVEILGFRLTGTTHPGGEFGFAVYLGGTVVRVLRAHCPSEADDWQHTDTGPAHPLEAQAPPESPAPADLISPARQAAILAALGIDADQLLVDRSAHSQVIELSTRPGGRNPADLADPQPAPEAPPAPDPTGPEALSWEDEVTSLLVTAVTDALPEDDQVPWLDAMTEDLEAGETRAALDRARDLLARGHRPAEEREAAADRLAILFGLAS
ncbi:MAG: hypothetical protein JXQ91_01885 [Vannielia sp.]|uniref:hypothetical protein n=1 Tax=Vannielia sp. TaxID=2813045 RepID=UPI003B8D0A92